MAEGVDRLGEILSGETNVGSAERIASALGGGALAVAGLKRGGAGGALLALAGAVLVQRGATGHCPVYAASGIDTSGGEARRLPASHDRGVRVEAAITVDRAADEAYRLWRDFARAPQWMERIVSVAPAGEGVWRWTARGPLGREPAWEARLTEDAPGERVAWESVPGAELPNRGSVRFSPATRPDATVVRYTLEFDPPGGALGRKLAELFDEVPQEMAKADLRRFKQLLETGQVTTVEGQPSGRG